MKTVVVYRSKSGFVKKYAEWIAEALGADLFDAANISIKDLMPYDTVIYGGGLYVAGINGVKLITHNLEKLKGKKLVVFASGATPPRQEDIGHVIRRNFTEDQQKAIRFFYLRGGFDNSRLTAVDKLLMALLKQKIKGKNKRSADERGMLAAYDKPVDFTKKQYIDALIDYVKS